MLVRELEPDESEAALFRSVLSALQDLRRLARKEGVRPGVTGQVGEVSYEQIFELLQKVRERNAKVKLRIVAAEDAWTAGPLKVRFGIGEAG